MARTTKRRDIRRATRQLRRDRAAEPGRRRRTPIVVTLGVLLLVTAGAVFWLTRLDLGGAASRHRGARTVSTTTSTTTRPPTTTTTTPPRAVRYQVREGDTLSAIAKRHGVTVGAIVLENRLANADHLTVGQTLVIPPPVPVRLRLDPATATPGATVELRLTGAQSRENVTFEITSPTGTFRGPPHAASEKGVATATYQLALDDPLGTYTVVANGDQGTTARAELAVTSPPTTRPPG